MKKLTVVILSVLICIGAFSSCTRDNGTTEETTVPQYIDIIPLGQWDMYYENYPDSAAFRIILTENGGIDFFDLAADDESVHYSGEILFTADDAIMSLTNDNSKSYNSVYNYSFFEGEWKMSYKSGDELPIINYMGDEFTFIRYDGISRTEEWIYEEDLDGGRLHTFFFHQNTSVDYLIKDKKTGEILEKASGNYYADYKDNGIFEYEINIHGENEKGDTCQLSTVQQVTYGENTMTARLIDGDPIISAQSKENEIVFLVDIYDSDEAVG